MTAPSLVTELVEKFDAQKGAYRSPQYNEAQTRQEFLNPLFEALGWDVYNRKGHSETYKEVIHEDAIRVGGRTKAPDYCFRVGGGVRTFFVEAKKPAVDVHEAIEPAYQLRRYAWSAKLPLGILTDFEELAIYDCRIRPVKTDKASTARVKYLKYTDYVDRWSELYDLLSPEAIRRGSIEKFLGSRKVKKGTAEVDVAFLAEIESWRNDLARNVATRNPGVSQRDLNFAVQRTIDRIVFLRICEDRGVEPYGVLQKLLNGSAVYARLGEVFQRADERYNSGLFYFTREPGRLDPPDEMTLALEIDDKALKDILKNLYFPDSPYEFSVLPAEILGQIYEQFLGKVIRLTKGHQARVEEKPEVRKAGGVYYTPSYIVDYIVRQTVGRLVKGKSPRGVGKLRVLDPACGSGSFLIGAYQFLLDWHRDWYEAHEPQKHARGRNPKVYRGRAGEWRLTTAERKRILVNNVFGVDIDSQAVEVTKLSLLLKVLEGESRETLDSQFRLFHERALPDLGGNIKCGNSLVEPDYYTGRQREMFDEDELYRVNAFDWRAEFPEILKGKNPGFDAVIGNPPYVLLQSLGSPVMEEYLSNRYESAAYKIDTYHVFLEQACLLAKDAGMVGMITPNTYLRNKYAIALRRFLLQRAEVMDLLLFDFGVFPRVSVDTVVTILQRAQEPDDDHQIALHRASSVEEMSCIGTVRQRKWKLQADMSFGLPQDGMAARITKHMEACSVRLGEFATAYFGIQTHGREQYVQKRLRGANWKPALDGENISRYALSGPREYVCLNPEAVKSGGNSDVYEQERIGVRQIGRRPIATLLPAGWYSLNTIYNVYFTRNVEYCLKYILGLLCSKLLGFYWEQHHFDQKRTFPKIKKAPLLSIPVRKINFD
ncbi:MAG: N-6 DNA methylase, partial [Sedimentisphaerales bacterium]|nr:N-6 DNA methylase [Sedimentisphaerales bacterium]